MTSPPRAYIHLPTSPVSVDEMHDLVDVYMNAIHTSFAGKTIDGRALAAAFIGSALGTVRDLGYSDPKATITGFLEIMSKTEITNFTPTKSD